MSQKETEAAGKRDEASHWRKGAEVMAGHDYTAVLNDMAARLRALVWDSLATSASLSSAQRAVTAVERPPRTVLMALTGGPLGSEAVWVVRVHPGDLLQGD